MPATRIDDGNLPPTPFLKGRGHHWRRLLKAVDAVVVELANDRLVGGRFGVTTINVMAERPSGKRPSRTEEAAFRPDGRDAHPTIGPGTTSTDAECVYRDTVSDFFSSLFAALAARRGLEWPHSPTIELCRGILDDWTAGGIAPAVGLGSVYQHLLSYHPEFRGDAFALVPIKTSARKSSGSYYTPDVLIDGILDRALDPILDAADSVDKLLSINVCDPACGCGLFLIAAARRIAERLTLAGYEGNALAAAVRHCIHGVDIDPTAVALCRFVLRLECCEPALEIDGRVHCANSLVDMPTVLGEGRRKSWDVVVGNPPWLSLSGRQRVHVDRGPIEAGYPEMREWPAVHSAFLLMCSRLPRNGGRVGLVLPLPMAYLDGYARVRAAIDAVADGVDVVDAGEAAFDRVVQATGLFSFGIDRKLEPGSTDGRAWPITSRMGDVSTVRELDPAVRRLLELPTVPAKVFSDPGVHTGNMSGILIVEEPGRSGLPIREGRDVAAYCCAPARRYLNVDAEVGEGQYCRFGELVRYASVPIVMRQTSDRPIAARHVDPTYFRNSMLACAGLPDVSIEVMLAVLNSDLIARWYRSQFGDASQRSFPQIKIRNLQRMPMFDRARLVDVEGAIAVRVRSIEAAVRSEDTSTVDGLRGEVEGLVCRLYGVERVVGSIGG